MDWIGVKQLVAAGMIEEDGHQVSNLGATALSPKAGVAAKTQPVLF